MSCDWHRPPCLYWSTFLAMALVGCATVRPPEGKPLLGTLDVGEVGVEAIAVGDASSTDREWFRVLLGDQASARARRTTLGNRLAAVIVRTPAEAGENYRLVGRVSLPVALPREIRGSTAAFTKGELATARVELFNGRGGVVATADSSVGWGEVRWTIGGHKMRRPRNPDLALVDAAELAIERALKRLMVELRRRGTSVDHAAGPTR